jgi:hypothetical protein
MTEFWLIGLENGGTIWACLMLNDDFVNSGNS